MDDRIPDDYQIPRSLGMTILVCCKIKTPGVRAHTGCGLQGKLNEKVSVAALAEEKQRKYNK
jgi:hypothetical protein